jgi:hypothetical protein
MSDVPSRWTPVLPMLTLQICVPALLIAGVYAVRAGVMLAMAWAAGVAALGLLVGFLYGRAFPSLHGR